MSIEKLALARRALVPVSLSLIALFLIAATVGAAVHPEARRVISMWKGAPAEAAYHAGSDTPAPLLRFTVAGDVGTGDDEEYETAAAMTRLLREGPIDGFILLGDNVYPDGDPELLDETVFIPFGSLLYSGTELLPILGNHDVENGNGPGQIETLGMPGRWYSHEFDDLLFIGLDSTSPTDPQQRLWLENTLAASTAKWKIVATHHPPYSAGHRGSDHPSRETFVPIFEKYDVDLVLSGHDHDYQRSNVLNGVTYVVSGGGGKIRPTSSEEFTAVSWSVHHFVELKVFEHQIFGQAYAQDGRVFDDFTLSSNG
jgi:3',5'-cyclic AMP phosphodiesterase CpdA